ncbi:hypothetical protein NW754_000867 [Fusarium falciforme]|nr:hypothetical protein NW754_000867 [Fusarium falciforme]
MLERTAAGLETRSLQRAIRQSHTPNRSRQLRTGFWQHGASAIELASALPSSSRAVDVEAASSDLVSRQLQPTLVASAFMLDFLYPTSTPPAASPDIPQASQFPSWATDSCRDTETAVLFRAFPALGRRRRRKHTIRIDRCQKQWGQVGT